MESKKVTAIFLVLCLSMAPVSAGCGWSFWDYAAAAGGAAVAVVGAPVVLGAAGFGAAGIGAGTLAAKAMSVAAPTVAGGAVATFQSIGAAGLGAAATIVTGSVGAAAGKAVKNKLDNRHHED